MTAIRVRPILARITLAGLFALPTAFLQAATAQAAVVCPTVSASGQVDPAPVNGVNWSGCDLSGANLAGASLSNANLSDANLAGANLSGADLIGAGLGRVNASDANFGNADLTNAGLFELVVTGANFAGATLTGVSSPVRGTPAALPAHWKLVRVAPSFEPDSAYLAGPGADLVDANLHGLDAHGVDLAGAFLIDADLAAVNLSDANLSSADLTGTKFTNRLSKKRANLTGANLAYAMLRFSDLTPDNAELSGVKWLLTECPNGTDSGQFFGGCFGRFRQDPVAVSIHGVEPGGTYVIDGFKIFCRTKDAYYPLTARAKLKITRMGTHGIGEITATCAGATDAGGYKSKPVSVSYAVLYGFGGFTAPKPGVAISLKAHRFTATFRLVTGSGATISDSQAAGLAKAGEVKVTLTGPGITATTVRCGWKTTARRFSCVVPIPAGAEGGTSGYVLTALEKPGLPGFITGPGVGGASNPQPVTFK